jgi:hypothetical protein
MPFHEPSIRAETANAPTVTTANDANEGQSPSWTRVVKKRSKSRPHSQITRFQQSSIVATACIDQRDKRQESNPLVAGLQNTDEKTDRALFTDSCFEEFETQPDIVYKKKKKK